MDLPLVSEHVSVHHKLIRSCSLASTLTILQVITNIFPEPEQAPQLLLLSLPFSSRKPLCVWQDQMRKFFPTMRTDTDAARLSLSGRSVGSFHWSGKANSWRGVGVGVEDSVHKCYCGG